jgi:thymidylate synthase (FAD)
MLLVKPSFEVLNKVNGQEVLAAIEAAGRTCYKSEDKISADSAKRFVKGLISRGHESVLEHQSVSAWIMCDRGVSHELVRHRIASFCQESTRYCNYSGGVTFIIPPWVEMKQGVCTDGEIEHAGAEDACTYFWLKACKVSERLYLNMLGHGWTPQQARTALNNSTKTEVVMTANLREWRHFFKLRAAGEAGAPHPQMLEIAVPMLARFKELIPVVFDDITPLEVKA